MSLPAVELVALCAPVLAEDTDGADGLRATLTRYCTYPEPFSNYAVRAVAGLYTTDAATNILTKVGRALAGALSQSKHLGHSLNLLRVIAKKCPAAMGPFRNDVLKRCYDLLGADEIPGNVRALLAPFFAHLV